MTVAAYLRSFSELSVKNTKERKSQDREYAVLIKAGLSSVLSDSTDAANRVYLNFNSFLRHCPGVSSHQVLHCLRAHPRPQKTRQRKTLLRLILHVAGHKRLTAGSVITFNYRTYILQSNLWPKSTNEYLILTTNFFFHRECKAFYSDLNFPN